LLKLEVPIHCCCCAWFTPTCITDKSYFLVVPSRKHSLTGNSK